MIKKLLKIKIVELRKSGLSMRRIAKKVGLSSPSTVAFHLSKKDKRFYLTENELLELREFIPKEHYLYKRFNLHQFQESASKLTDLQRLTFGGAG